MVKTTLQVNVPGEKGGVSLNQAMDNVFPDREAIRNARGPIGSTAPTPAGNTPTRESMLRQLEGAATQLNQLQGQLDARNEITSSNQPVSNNAVSDAKNKAANDLVGGTPPPPTPGGGNAGQNQQSQMGPYQQLQQGMWQQGQEHLNQMQGNYEAAQKALQMTYDASLAATDFKYGQLFNELESNYQQNLEVAQYNAQALNPYSQSAGAQTAANFTGKLTQNYQNQALNLQRQADLARQELAAGNYEAYVSLHNNMQESNRQFQNQMMSFMLDTTQSIEESRQFEIQEQRANSGMYIDTLANSQLPTPEVINSMTNEQLASLPAAQQGLRAGYDMDGIRQDLLGAANMQVSEAQDAALDRQIKIGEYEIDLANFELDKAYRQAQVDNLYDQIRSRRDSDSGTDDDEPISWNEYLSAVEAESEEDLSLVDIEKHRFMFQSIYKEKGIEPYTEENVPNALMTDIRTGMEEARDEGVIPSLAQIQQYTPELNHSLVEQTYGEVFGNEALRQQKQAESQEEDSGFSFSQFIAPALGGAGGYKAAAQYLPKLGRFAGPVGTVAGVGAGLVANQFIE